VDKTIAYIQVRGGSKGIPLKNINMFNGKPLVMWCAEEAANAGCVDEVYVVTDYVTIYHTVEAWKQSDKITCWMTRNISDTEFQEDVMLEVLKDVGFGHVILLQATTPSTKSQDIDEAFNKYIDGSYDSLVSVTKQHKFFWNEDNGIATPVNYDPLNRPRRQDWDGILIENGAFFITSKESLFKTKCRLSGKIGTYTMPKSSGFEIDDVLDWMIAENLIRG